MRSRDGFTLLELIVGMFIATIALAAGFGALGFVGDRSRHAETASVEALEGMATRELLVDWIAGARLRGSQRGQQFQGLDAVEHGLTSDELIVPTTAATPLRAGVTLVRLFIDIDPLTPEQGLVAELSELLTDLPRRVELLPSAIGMEIRYLSNVDGLQTWSYSWVSGNTLPAAIELSVWSEPVDATPRLLQLPVRVALGAAR